MWTPIDELAPWAAFTPRCPSAATLPPFLHPSRDSDSHLLWPGLAPAHNWSSPNLAPFQPNPNIILETIFLNGQHDFSFNMSIVSCKFQKKKTGFLAWTTPASPPLCLSLLLSQHVLFPWNPLISGLICPPSPVPSTAWGSGSQT